MTAISLPPLRYELSGTIGPGLPLGEGDLEALYPHLDACREEMLGADLKLLGKSKADLPSEKVPLDSGFFEMPEKILKAYHEDRDESELGRILATAGRLRESVDRVVVLGIGGSYMGAKALFDACLHPYHNELSRADRGGVPKIYFEGNNVDNDATSGLLDMLEGQDDWAIVVISKSGRTLETAVAFRKFLAALQKSLGGDAKKVAERVIPVTGKDEESRLFQLAHALKCPDVFAVPNGVGGRFSVLSPVGLLPAAVMGIDVVKLLEGAAQMNEQFRTAAPADNLVIRYAGVCIALENGYNMHTRILSTWGKSLEAAGLWYDQLLAESLGKHELGALPLTVVNTRDLHSRGQQHQEGARDKMITNLIIDSYRCDPLAVGHSDLNQDELNELAEKTLPEIMDAAIKGTNQAYVEVRRPVADLHLPAADEASLGQYFQMMMIATVLEGRYLQINPYGQPGVEAYKDNMTAILRGE